MEPRLPVYDHAGFIAKERAGITVRAATVIRDHKEETDKILDREERDAKRAVRRSVEGHLSKALEAKVEEFFEQWKEGIKRSVFPEETPARVIATLNEFMAEIAMLDAKLLNELSRYQGTYAKKLRNKSLWLEKENVTASVDAIKAELDALAKEGYFLAIVSSEDPSPDTYVAEGEEEGGVEVKEGKKRRDRGKGRGKGKGR